MPTHDPLAVANLLICYLSADCSLPVNVYVVLASCSVINVGLSFMYISASDLRVASYWIITNQHSLVCDFTCTNTLPTRLCKCVFHDLSLACGVYVVSTSASD